MVLKHHKDIAKYIAYMFQTPLGTYYIDTTKGGSTIYTISQEKIGNYEFPFPTLSEQQLIVDYLENKCAEIDSLIAIKQQKIDELKFITGNTDVQNGNTPSGVTAASGGHPRDLESADLWIDLLERENISYCMWAFSKAPEACSAIRSTVPKYNGFTRDDYTETGLWLLDTLSAHSGR